MKKEVKYTSANVKLFIKETLKKYTGFPPLKVWQENIIKNVLSRKDTLIVMPPSDIKYLCFYLPILILKGICIVVSPSEKFIKAQVKFLNKMGIPYNFIEDINKGNIDSFKVLIIKNIKILEEIKTYLTFDIKYIIFGTESDSNRNDLQYLDNLKDTFKDIPFVVSVSNPDPEIRNAIKIKGIKIFVKGYNRPNIRYMVIKGEEKLEKIADIISKVPDSGMIFVDSKRNAETIDKFLKNENFSSDIYFNKNINETANKFINEDTKTVITTREFYRNLIRPDIRFIIHYNLPLSLTDYYFETYAAGMDGKKCYSVLLYHPNDKYEREEQIRAGYDETDNRKDAFSKLEIMEDYIFSNSCRMSYILSFFGDEEVMERCGKCDICVGYKKELMLKRYDINMVRKILKCIAELREKFGINTIVDVLRGKGGKTIAQYNLADASTYGILKDSDRKIIKEIINNLILDKYITVMRGLYPTIELTQWGRKVIKDEEIFEINLPKFIDKKADKPFDPVLFEQLRIVRRRIARRLNIPTFQVFLDRVLQDFATYLPETEEEMSKIKGVAKTKSLLFGKKFIDAIKKYKMEKESFSQ